ncbi:MAG: hypothetical protein Q4C61_07900 [Lachnospiraceae bacterium]|nr:hypothetical protein [Lachnospiraceae bacterium]
MSESGLPKLEVSDIIHALDSVCSSQVDTAGSTKPLLECITSGVLRGAVVMLGCDDSTVRDTEEYVALMKKLIENDIVLLAIGYPVTVAQNAGLLNPEAKDLCGAGLKRVCELAEIPPVLPLGGLENINNVITIAQALSADSGLAVPALPVVGCDAAGVSAQAVELGNAFTGLGVDTFIGIMPYEGALEDVIAASGLKDGAEAKHTVSSDLNELCGAMIADIEKKRASIAI